MSTAVFRDYDQEALDREYDNRRKVSNAAEYLARYPKESARARAELDCRLDVAYGVEPGKTLDIFPPAGQDPAPIQVFIHGGYWRALDKADFSFVARAFHPAGAATVIINYALVPSVDMDTLVNQCRASIAWLYRNAGSFGGDPHRIFISGHSAGGHLAAMLMATDWSAFPGLPRDLIKGGCGISGLYDLEPIRLCFLNATLKLAPESAQRLSPVHLAPTSSGPCLLALGEREGPEYHRQTDELAAAWRRHRVAVEVLDMSGHDHFSIVTELEQTSSVLSRAIQRQMGLR